MPSIELKPCPFCGGLASMRLYYRGTYGAECDRCGIRGHVLETRAEAAEAWNTRADAYTREECESAFVSGYSLGTLPVGSDPRWDENRQTVDEHMAELGWVRERTCVVEEVVKRERALGAPTWNYQFSCGHFAYEWPWKEAPAYCPDCGAKVVG